VTVWLTRQLILAIHDEQLAEHGGAIGIRDDGLLESALARPLNRAGYGDPDVAELARCMPSRLRAIVRLSMATSALRLLPCSCTSR
jgi:prophage maintenance system killer protein